MSIRRLIVLLCTACYNWVCYLCLKNEAQTKYCLIPVRKVNYISKRRLVSSLLERMPLALPIPSAHSTESSDVPTEQGESVLDQMLVLAFQSRAQISVVLKMGGAKLEIWIELVSMVTKILLSF